MSKTDLAAGIPPPASDEPHAPAASAGPAGRLPAGPAGAASRTDADADARALIARLDAAATHRTVRVGDCPVAWRCFGHGPPLVLLHGGHGSWLHWIACIEPLARHHTLWLPDMPGYGDSGLPAGEQTLDLLVDTLAAAVDRLPELAAAPYDLAGFSFGGLCAATLAARRPAAVRRLALLGPSGHGQLRPDRTRMLDWRGLPPGPERDERLRHNLAVLMLHDPQRIDPLALAVHREACAATRWRSKGLSMRALLPVALATLAAAPEPTPVLLAWGEHDATAHPQQAGAFLQEIAPQSRLVVVPGAGHWVQYEAAPQTVRLLADWFA